MNKLINTHYASVSGGSNEYRVYECTKRKGTLKYIAVVHSSFTEDILDKKLLIEKIPCAMPVSWSISIIRKLDSNLSRLQILSNSDLNYLVFSAVHKDYISKKVQEIITHINEIYLKIE
jgi:hypothetical protein